MESHTNKLATHNSNQNITKDDIEELEQTMMKNYRKIAK